MLHEALGAADAMLAWQRVTHGSRAGLRSVRDRRTWPGATVRPRRELRHTTLQRRSSAYCRDELRGKAREELERQPE